MASATDYLICRTWQLTFGHEWKQNSECFLISKSFHLKGKKTFLQTSPLTSLLMED